MYDKRGSIWRKWDLHIHCPTSVLNNQFDGSDIEEKWEKYLDQLESIDDVSVLAVTDYFSIDGYRSIKQFDGDSRLENFDLIIPNCELRLLPVTSTERAINFHFIFDPIIVDELDTLFFSKLEFEYGGEPYQCKKTDLIRLGRNYSSDQGLDEKSAYKEGVNQFKVSPSNLSRILKKSKQLRKHCITGVSNSSNDGNSGIQHSSLAATREEIYRLADFIYSSNPNDRKYFLGEGVDSKEEVIRKYGSLKPCIHGSDAHKLEDICNPDEGRYTWIKGDPTFEGLKQIIFEPKHRVKIDANQPNEPLIKLNKVKIDLPTDSKLDGEDYCIKGEYEIQFSPFYTCFIGGRGTGKSSILNLIDHLISDEKNKFFEQHNLTDEESNKLLIEELVSLDEKSEKGDIEFLSQNEVEEFAQDQSRFTDAIYRRLLKLDSENVLEDSVSKLYEHIELIIHKASQYNTIKTLRKEIKALRNEIEKNENILSSLKDEDYQSNNQLLSVKTKRLKRIQHSKKILSRVLESIDDVIDQVPEDLDSSIPFERVLNQLSSTLKSVSDEYDIEQISGEASEEINSLKEEIEEISDKINSYLQDKGLSEENLKEASSAQTNLDTLKAELEEKVSKSESIEAQLINEDIDESNKEEYERILKEQLDLVNQRFQAFDENETVKEIKLEYEFDMRSAREFLIGQVQDWIKNSNTQNESDLRSHHLESRLPIEISDYESFIEELKTDSSITSNDLIKHFSNKYNYEIYKLMVKKEYLNAAKYKQINVNYDGRPIQSSSFGQRCTAAMVILLSLGNNPIIIDEPEAHLDSALIADNLVDLIKDTKPQRQVIFATHNANFVINGDAELIHVLSIDENDGNKMKINSTTIEDLQNRHHLFALEGGEKAFKQRERKYSII